MATASILALPMEGKDFDYLLWNFTFLFGCILIQDKNVIYYASFQLNMHERNFPTHDLEFLAMVFALKFLQRYIYGIKFEVFFIDHHNL